MSPASGLPVARLLPLPLLTALAIPAAAQPPHTTYVPPERDVAAVRQAVLDYVEALYLVDTTRIARGVSRGLAKIGVEEGSTAPLSITDHRMSYDELVELAAEWNADRDVGPDAIKEIVVFDVLDYTASVKLVAAWGVDYVHLARYGDRWLIVNVVYQRHPRP